MGLELKRRGFLSGILAFCAGPAIVRATSIMPVRAPIIIETTPILFTQPDLTLSLSDFSERILRPAMRRLARDLEMDILEQRAFWDGRQWFAGSLNA